MPRPSTSVRFPAALRAASLVLMCVCRAHRTAPLSLMGAGGAYDVADVLGTIYDGTRTMLMVTKY